MRYVGLKFGVFAGLVCLAFFSSPRIQAQQLKFNEAQLRAQISSLLEQTEIDLSEIPDQAEANYEFRSLQAYAIDYLIEALRSGDFDDNTTVQLNLQLPRGQDSLVLLYRELFKTRGEKIPFVMGQYEELLNTINSRYAKTHRRGVRSFDENVIAGMKDSLFRWQTTTLALMAAGYTNGESVKDWIDANKESFSNLDRMILFGKSSLDGSGSVPSLLIPTDTAPTLKTKDGAVIINPIYRRWNDFSGKTVTENQDPNEWRQANFDFRTARSTLGLLVDEIKKTDSELNDDDKLASLVAAESLWPQSLSKVDFSKKISIIKMLMRHPPTEASDIRGTVKAVTNVFLSNEDSQEILDRLTSYFRYTLRKRRMEVKYMQRSNKISEIFSDRIAYASEKEPLEDERAALFLDLMERLSKDFEVLASLPEDPEKIDQGMAEKALYDLVRKTKDGEIAKHRDIFLKTAQAYAGALDQHIDDFILDHLLDWHAKAVVKLAVTDLAVSDALNGVGAFGLGALHSIRIRGFTKDPLDKGELFWSRWLIRSQAGEIFSPQQINEITTPIIGANRIAQQKEIAEAFRRARELERNHGQVPVGLERRDYQPVTDRWRPRDESEFIESADEIIQTIEGIIETQLRANEYYNSKKIERPEYFLTAHLFDLTREAFENEYLDPNVRISNADQYFAKSIFLYVIDLYQDRDPLLKAQLADWIAKAEAAEKKHKNRELKPEEREDIREALANFQKQFLAFKAAGYDEPWRALRKVPDVDSDRIQLRWKIVSRRQHVPLNHFAVARPTSDTTEHDPFDIEIEERLINEVTGRPSRSGECEVVIRRIGRDSFEDSGGRNRRNGDTSKSWGKSAKDFPRLRTIQN